MLCSILAITSCSFVVSVTWSESYQEERNGITKIGPFRYYNATSHSCASYWSDRGTESPTGHRFVYTWTSLDGIYALFSMTIATIGVACGGVATVILLARHLLSISQIGQHMSLSEDIANKLHKWALRLLVGSSILQSATIAVFLYNPRYSSCVIGKGAIFAFVSVVMYGSSALTLLFASTTSSDIKSGDSNYPFDVEHDQLGRPLVDPQSNYGQLPPWVHTIS